MTYYRFFVHLNDSGKVSCFECGAMMRSIYNYKLHLKFYHSQNVIKVHSCIFCGLKYADPINCAIHQLNVHLNAKK